MINSISYPRLDRINTFAVDSNEAATWFESATDNAKGICLILHGLNLRPSKMNALVRLWTQNGYHVLRGRLQGHGEINKITASEYKKLDFANLWREDFRYYMSLVKKLSDQTNLPVTLFGYSLGALVMSEMLLQKKIDVKLEKLIFLAPPFYTRWYAKGPHLLARCLPPSFPLISFNLSNYANSSSISMAFYTGFFELQTSWRKHILNLPTTSHNIPTLILMDPKDELVSFHKLQKFIRNNSFINWRLIPLHIKKSQLPLTYHHLIIDEKVLGGHELWAKLSKAVINF